MSERFQQYWPNVDRENYASLTDPHLPDPLLQELKSSTVSFLKTVLAGRTGYMPRDVLQRVNGIVSANLGRISD